MINEIFQKIQKNEYNKCYYFLTCYNFIIFIILYLLYYLEKTINNHYPNPCVDSSVAMDYLCLKSGHNDMSKVLLDFLKTKFDYELDVVSIKNISSFII